MVKRKNFLYIVLQMGKESLFQRDQLIFVFDNKSEIEQVKMNSIGVKMILSKQIGVNIQSSLIKVKRIVVFFQSVFDLSHTDITVCSMNSKSSIDNFQDVIS